MQEFTEAQQIEVTLKEAHEAQEMRDALVKLEKSYVFKKVILREFFEEEAKVMAPLVGSPNEAASKGAINVCTAIGVLGSFFNKVHRKGAIADQAVADLEATKMELANEE